MTHIWIEEAANANGSTPAATVAVEPIDQPLTNNVKLFKVTVAADIQLRLTGCVNIYASDEDQAEERVQAQIDNGTLDVDMEDDDFGFVLHSSAIGWSSGEEVGIDSIEVVDEDIDPLDVLKVQVKELEARVFWKPSALAKQKAFLESLLHEGGDKQAVAA